MKTKFVEIRDRATCIPAVAIQMISADPIEDRFLWHCGYPGNGRLDGTASVVLMRLDDQKAASDPYDWGGCHTMTAAHLHVCTHFDDLRHGQVVDVRVLLGEAREPTQPELYADEQPSFLDAAGGRAQPARSGRGA